jgi:hypothetical protein
MIEYDKIVKEKEYEGYFQPVICLDADLNITYKNTAAKIVNIKPRAGTNIKKYMDDANIEKLCAAVEQQEFKIIKLNVVSSVKRCVLMPDGESATVLMFFDALNPLKDDSETESEIIKEAEDIIHRYNADIKNIIKENQVKFSPENIKKMIRAKEHLKKHMLNLNPKIEDKYKIYCDIGRFFKNFSSGVSPYINSFGYKIAFKIEDKMYLYKLNESDLMTINFIMATFAFKYSLFNKVDICFSSDFHMAKLQYEFRAGSDFAENHRDMFVKNYLNEIKDIRYLDLNLAALIAKNNDLKLNVYFDPENGGKVCMDLIFYNHNKKGELSSPVPGECMNYITVEEIKGQAEIEFAGVFGE